MHGGRYAVSDMLHSSSPDVEVSSPAHMAPDPTCLSDATKVVIPNHKSSVSHQPRCTVSICKYYMVQWSEDVIKADPFFGRSRVRFRVPPGFRTQLHETTSLGQEEAL